jgi:hypothetical protein
LRHLKYDRGACKRHISEVGNADFSGAGATFFFLSIATRCLIILLVSDAKRGATLCAADYCLLSATCSVITCNSTTKYLSQMWL